SRRTLRALNATCALRAPLRLRCGESERTDGARRTCEGAVAGYGRARAVRQRAVGRVGFGVGGGVGGVEFGGAVRACTMLNETFFTSTQISYISLLYSFHLSSPHLHFFSTHISSCPRTYPHRSAPHVALSPVFHIHLRSRVYSTPVSMASP
ncbi:hypothetical protein C8R43DRAFT_485604, partial [Mycena crocata]